ncbi:MAG TPA: hypothetical protein VHT23_12745 [Gemmatimonadaceae bacterium]|nr:hypothetical protein [Gemmatimonadaceae bacterium]
MIRTTRLAFIAALIVPAALAAQQPADTTRPAPPPAPAPAPTVSIPVDFSGVLYANFQYQGAKGATKSQNKFDLERAYLTFRMPAGDRASIRITADVFQQQGTPADAYYKGWVVRAKYAYLQYDYLKGGAWTGVARAGLIHNVVIDHIEQFWPRWISQTAVERAGFFSSADAGVGTLITLPNKFGELYANVVNGPGYTSRETDRFKDYAARLTITPLSGSSNKVIKTFALSGWTYQGRLASAFVNGGAGQVGQVGSSLPRTRSGIFVGVRDPRLSAGFDFATRKDGVETGLNTVASPRAEIDSTRRLISGFATIKPFQLLSDQSTFPLGLIGRWDRYKPSSGAPGYINTVIAGATWDLNKKSALSFDYQEQTPKNGVIAATTKTYFLHMVANF